MLLSTFRTDATSASKYINSLGPGALRSVSQRLHTLSRRQGIPNLAEINTVLKEVRKTQRLRALQSAPKRRRCLVTIGYVDPCIERLHLASVLADPAITGVLPDDLWEATGKPLAAYAYAAPPFLTVNNASAASRNFKTSECIDIEPARDIDTEEAMLGTDGQLRATRCPCMLPSMRRFVNPNLGHICTTDTDIIKEFDAGIADLLAKGTKHRTKPAVLLPVDKEDDGSAADAAEARVINMMSVALNSFYKQNITDNAKARGKCSREMFSEYEELVLAKVKEFTTSLSVEEKERLLDATDDAPLSAAQLGILEKIHEVLHVNEADKEAGRYTFTCRYLHDRWMQKETTGADSNYRPDGRDKGPVIENIYEWSHARGYVSDNLTSNDPKHKDFTQPQLFAVLNRIATLYISIKTHKDTPAARFIAGGRDNAIEAPCKWLHRILWSLKDDVDDMHCAIFRDTELEQLAGRFSNTINSSLIVNKSVDVVRRIRELSADVKHLKHTGKWPEHTTRENVHFGVHDFTSLFTTFKHDVIRDAMLSILTRIFDKNSTNGNRQFVNINRHNDDDDQPGNTWTDRRPDKQKKNARTYDLDEILELVDFILDNAYACVGNTVLKQTCGIPMGYSASPMLANFVLCHFEITGLEKMVKDALATPDGADLDTPSGPIPADATTRLEALDRASRIGRSARMIDDVLFINLTKEEQLWAVDRIYLPTATGLSTKMECCSPGPVVHMDLQIKWDEHGPHTILYDKRVDMAARGKIGSVRRCPHIDSVLSDTCKYGTLPGFLHRAHRNIMRRAVFAGHAVTHNLDMFREGYNLRKLQRKTASFITHHYLPRRKAPLMLRWINGQIDRGAAEQKQRRRRLDRIRAQAAARLITRTILCWLTEFGDSQFVRCHAAGWLATVHFALRLINAQRACILNMVGDVVRGSCDLDAKISAGERNGRPMWAYRYDMRGKDLWVHLLMHMRDAPPRAPPTHEAGDGAEDPRYFIRDTNASDGDPSGGKATAWVDWPIAGQRASASLRALAQLSPWALPREVAIEKTGHSGKHDLACVSRAGGDTRQDTNEIGKWSGSLAQSTDLASSTAAVDMRARHWTSV